MGLIQIPIKRAMLASARRIVYLLYDTFETALAAGSVNGTASEPGPNALANAAPTRTVTDTNSKLSVTGGVLNFATGGVTTNDPGLWYPAQTPTLGKVLIGVLNNTSNRSAIGYCTTSGGTQTLGILFIATALNSSIAGTNLNVGVIVQGVSYQCCIIHRGTGLGGGWFLIKGGSFTNWTMIWSFIGGASPTFPGVLPGASGTTNVFTADNIRIPQPLYIPNPLAYDTFTRANGALGSTETVGPDGQSLAALVWVFTAGVWAVVSNVAVATPNLGSDVIVNGGFATDTDWAKGAGWTIAAGTAVATAASSDISATVAPLTTGTWYQSVFTQGGFGGGTVNVKLGTTAFPTHGANGTFTETGRALSTAFALTGAGLTDTIDNVSCKPLTLADLFTSVVVSSADVIADVAITLESSTSGKQAGLVLNLDSATTPANFILAYLDGRGNVLIDECVAGTYTNKQTTAVTYSAGAVLRVVRNGTELRVFYNNAAVGALLAMTTNANKNHGLFSTSPLTTLDTFACWPRGTSGEYEQLSAY